MHTHTPFSLSVQYDRSLILFLSTLASRSQPILDHWIPCVGLTPLPCQTASQHSPAHQVYQCHCGGSQTPKHILMQCPLYTEQRQERLENIFSRTDLGVTADYDAIVFPLTGHSPRGQIYVTKRPPQAIPANRNRARNSETSRETGDEDAMQYDC